MRFSPVALFVYNRIGHLRLTIEALQRNKCAPETRLLVFSDGPKDGSESDSRAVDSVRAYVAGITGFESVQLFSEPVNRGLANSIVAGVSKVCAEYGRVIVLEDDLVTSPWFLQYMNDALGVYENVEEVISIHGYIYPVQVELPETFLLRGADCWGWATWRRGWSLFNSDGGNLLAELQKRRLTQAFDFEGAYGFTKMLRGQVTGLNDSWAIRWNASAFLEGKLTLYPGRSLVSNIGLDSSGTHCGSTEEYATVLAQNRVVVSCLPATENVAVRRLIEQYFRRSSESRFSWFKRLWRKMFPA